MHFWKEKYFWVMTSNREYIYRVLQRVKTNNIIK